MNGEEPNIEILSFAYIIDEGMPRVYTNVFPTLTTSCGGYHLPYIHEKTTGRIRKITPLEGERIMGFPDGWTDAGISDSRRYNALGNAVVPKVARFIGEQIIKHYRKRNDEL